MYAPELETRTNHAAVMRLSRRYPMRRWCDTCKDIVQDGPDPHPCFKLDFKPGDRVMLNLVGTSFYGGKWPHFTPEGQGGGRGGTVTQAAYRGENKPGAAPRPYMVQWDNGAVNSYRIEDLEPEDEAILRLTSTRATPITNPKILVFSTPK